MDVFPFYSHLDRTICKQTEETLIRRRVWSGSALFAYVHKKDARLIWVKGLIWPPLEQNTECCFSPISSDWFIIDNPNAKFWHLFHFYRCYGNTNGRQNKLKIEKSPFWTTFEVGRPNY